jgi:hypothetical protein
MGKGGIGTGELVEQEVSRGGVVVQEEPLGLPHGDAVSVPQQRPIVAARDLSALSTTC